MATIPLVSVSIVTYNHGHYIAQAIDSIVMQQVNFEYEIIIGEDCSSDNTREIIDKYQRKMPNIIKVIKTKANVGAMNNFARTLNSCRGKYIAMLDGDDYWIDPFKLQKQVDFLNSNKDCSLCFSACNIYDENTKEFLSVYYPPEKKVKYSIEDLLNNNFIATATAMFRRENIPKFPAWLHKLPAGDYGVFIINAKKGFLGYIDEIMATYRLHDGGMWSSQSNVSATTKNIELYTVILEYLKGEYSDIIRKKIFGLSYSLMHHYLFTNNNNIARKYASICIDNIDNNRKYVSIVKLYIKPRLPNIILKLIGIPEKYRTL